MIAPANNFNSAASSADMELMDAVIRCDPARVEALLEAGADPNEMENGDAALIWAAWNNQTEIACLLVEYGANVNKIGIAGGTAISGAVDFDNIELARLLISKGADANETLLVDGITLLMSAASKGNKEMVQLLLDNGAVPEAVDKKGHSAVDYAVDHFHLEVAQLLREVIEPRRQAASADKHDLLRTRATKLTIKPIKTAGGPA